MTDSNFVVKNGLVVNGAFTANSTVVNAAAVNATSYNISTSFVANATNILVGSTTAGANAFIANSTTLSVGNSSVNVFANSTHFFSGNSSIYGYSNSTAEGLVGVSANVTQNSSSLIITGNVATSASLFYIQVGNSTIYTTVNATSYSGIANNANNLGGAAASAYPNTSGAFTISGVYTHNANIIFGTSAVIIANGSLGAANTVLTSNGTGMYWSTPSAGLTQSKAIGLMMVLGF